MNFLKAAIKDQGKLLTFLPGQVLSEGNYLAGHVLLVESGSARLLYKKNGRLSTLKYLAPGSIIGAASILRGASCETVRAAEKIRAWSISDKAFIDLIRTNTKVAKECDSYLWEAELLALLEVFLSQSPRESRTIDQWLKKIGKIANLISINDIKEIDINSIKNKSLFLASQIKGKDMGGEILINENISAAYRSLKTRLILLPSEMVKEIKLGQTDSIEHKSNQIDENYNISKKGDNTLAPLKPPVSQFENSEKEMQDFFVGGEGTLNETLACFQMLSKLMKLPYRKDAIEKILKEAIRRGEDPSLRLCGNIAAGFDLYVSSAKVQAQLAMRLQTPCMLSWKNNFALVTRSDQAGITLASPKDGIFELTPDEIEEKFPEGLELLFFDRTNTTPEMKFGPIWFWPALKRYRNILIQVLIASFVIQLFTLANPLLIQVIIDKVINQRSLDTLQVLGIALLAVTILEGILGSLKTFLFAETTNRIDQRLGAEVIDHLLRLPLGYFDKRPVGELSSRVSELEKIRNFLTGQALTTLIDAAFSIIYILVMMIYSSILTLIALIVLPIQIGLTLLGAPIFRRQYRQSAEANAKTQSHLVEILGGIQTVKSQNIEMVSRWKWQDLYGQFISKTFSQTISITALSQASNVLQKISQLLVLWIGTTMVLDGKLTLGQLIAFRIISGYVTQPLLRLSSIWQNIQELKVSFERLADVIDTPQESSAIDKSNIPLPPIQGNVKIENLTFSFRKNSNPILKGVNLNISPGTFVGIVGQSGSGKSTLMKLISRLYSPEKGNIFIDGYDINKVELYSLRRQVGIVPQDPLLFSGTVSKNISLIQPEATNDEIIRAAKIAEAHDFIMKLDNGYSTDVGERGTSLSGGQKQRIAIARTILANPKLLVMDEATSALDYETERNVCNNLNQSLENCTVFFITHRLSTVRQADSIVVMHQGSVVEQGTHDELINKKGRYYALSHQKDLDLG